MALTRLIAAKLDALQYPHRAAFRLDDEVEAARLVLWLENRKIRQYPAGERGGLNYKAADAAAWRTNFRKYLTELVSWQRRKLMVVHSCPWCCACLSTRVLLLLLLLCCCCCCGVAGWSFVSFPFQIWLSPIFANNSFDYLGRCMLFCWLAPDDHSNVPSSRSPRLAVLCGATTGSSLTQSVWSTLTTPPRSMRASRWPMRLRHPSMVRRVRVPYGVRGII